MQCPKCGSEHVQKKGMRVGKQRYACCDCKACFTEGVEYIRQKKFRPVEGIECPRCHSTHIRRDGKSEGYQRYECCDCKKNFSEYALTHPKEKIEYKCPYCGGELRYSGYGRKGQREYYCKECHKSCSSDANGKPKAYYIFSEVNTKVRCPECNSLNIKKAGSSRGNKRFTCKDCGRIFLNIKGKGHTKSKKKEAIDLVIKGASVKEVAKQFNYTLDYMMKLTKEIRAKTAIKHVMEGYSIQKAATKNSVDVKRLQEILKKEYDKESISQEQKEMIIKYGIYLNVPIDYMAEYVHCSENKCKEVLEEYKRKQKVKL